MTISSEEDRQILSGCLSGDGQAAEQFVRRFSDLIYRCLQQTLISKHIPYTRDDLADFHNTVFMHLFDKKCRKLRQFEGKNGCSLATWVRTVTVRIALNEIRKKGVDGITGKRHLVPFDELAEMASDKAGAWEMMEQSEQALMLREAVGQLPARDRLFFKLHFEQELPIPEAARIIGITPQNAYTIKHRAVQKLKNHIAALTDHQ